jgi:hypothetical protein
MLASVRNNKAVLGDRLFAIGEAREPIGIIPPADYIGMLLLLKDRAGVSLVRRRRCSSGQIDMLDLGMSPREFAAVQR